MISCMEDLISSAFCLTADIESQNHETVSSFSRNIWSKERRALVSALIFLVKALGMSVSANATKIYLKVDIESQNHKL